MDGTDALEKAERAEFKGHRKEALNAVLDARFAWTTQLGYE